MSGGYTVTDYKGYTYRVRKDGKADRRYKYQPDVDFSEKPKGKTIRSVKKEEKPTIHIAKSSQGWKVLAVIWALALICYGLARLTRTIWEQTPDFKYRPVLTPFAEAREHVIVPPPEGTERPSWCQTEYEQLVCAKDWDDRLMVALMYAESGGDPLRKYAEADGTVSVGLFQINSVHGYTEYDLKNPVKNVDIAYEIYKTSGIYPWGAYTDGRIWEFY